MKIRLFLLFLLSFHCNCLNADLPQPCDSEIYCYGKLLHTVQVASVYTDSKTFVDMNMRNNASQVLETFDELYEKYNGSVPVDEIKTFLADNFINCDEDECDDLEKWTPSDWTSKPSIIKRIADPVYRDWALDLNMIWKNLSRRMSDDVKTNENMTSLIYVPNGFVIPGGRFTELYYWDTYWIIKGLLLCDMKETAKGVISNFLYLVKKLGHIPNGSRVYYSQRTQPPMLTLMMEEYVRSTGDWDFVSDNIETLEEEMNYFISNRRVQVEQNGSTFLMFHYYAPSQGPRPESYREDYNNAQKKLTDDDRLKFYVNMKSAAESGWDFSSRWFIANGTNQGTLLDIETEYIIPVDLNSLLHKVFSLLADWNTRLQRQARAEYFQKLSDDLLDGIETVLWNEDDGIWYDYEIMNNKSRKYFYVSNFVPLWTKSYKNRRDRVAARVLDYINKCNLFRYIGGTPTSLEYTNEQWDYPNAWPPLQAFLIQGLDRVGTFESMLAAYNLANKWISTNYLGYKRNKKMFEKYDALERGTAGGGGEYVGQDGFGWTNGVALEFLNRWGKIMLNSEADIVQNIQKTSS